MPTVNGHTNGTAQTWDSLPQALSKSVSSLQKILDNDKQWQAFVDTKAIIEPVTIGVASKGGDAVLVNVDSGSRTKVSTGSASKADFTLSAHGEQWAKFFDADPKSPYQSFVGLQVSHPAPLGSHVTTLTSLGHEHQTRRCWYPR
jgi:putative sterol carrier protein